jgi:hypothetical protein
MKKVLAAVGIAVAASATTLGVAAPANAQLSWYTKTVVRWTGASCIQLDYPGGSGGACGGGWEIPHQVVRGQEFGVDPVMGDANWIFCEVWIEGQVVYSDYAYAGDGTDVNCLRVKL